MNSSELERTVESIALELGSALQRCEQFLSKENRKENCKENREEAKVEFFSAMDSALDCLSETDIWGEANRLLSSRLWNATRQWLERGHLQRRAREKPRGYAGDFQMLDQIWREDRCSDPLGNVMDQYFQDQAAPRAVRNRLRLVGDAMAAAAKAHNRSEPFQIVSIGAGSARDVAWALEQLDIGERALLRIVLLDMDPEALDFASQLLTPLAPPNSHSEPWLRMERTNLFRLSKDNRLERLVSGTHLLSCTGLFDYLDVNEAVRMLGAFRRAIAPSGRMLVFNFSTANPTRAYMEWIGNWYLRYRSADDLERLAQCALHPADHWRVASEPLEVNLYLDVEIA